MKYFRLPLAVGAVILAFNIPAFAGQIETMIASTGNTSSEATTISPVIEIALNLAQGLLALF